MHLSSISADVGNFSLDAPLLPIPDLSWLPIHMSRLRRFSKMAATTMSRIFTTNSRPYSNPSASSSTHTSATVTPTLARPVPVSVTRSESPYIPEPEVDAWCAVCDRLIVVARPANEEDAEGNPSGSKSKVDENGVPHFIKPMPARIPAKKLKVSRASTFCFAK